MPLALTHAAVKENWEWQYQKSEKHGQHVYETGHVHVSIMQCPPYIYWVLLVHSYINIFAHFSMIITVASLFCKACTPNYKTRSPISAVHYAALLGYLGRLCNCLYTLYQDMYKR